MSRLRIRQLRQITRWLQGTDIVLLELGCPGQSIRLRRAPSGAQRAVTAARTAQDAVPDAVPASPPVPALVSTLAPTLVCAGAVGIVLHCHPLRTAPLAAPGQPVAAGQALALLRIGQLLLPVPSPRAGVVGRILCPHGSVAGFGTPLLEIE